MQKNTKNIRTVQKNLRCADICFVKPFTVQRNSSKGTVCIRVGTLFGNGNALIGIAKGEAVACGVGVLIGGNIRRVFVNGSSTRIYNAFYIKFKYHLFLGCATDGEGYLRSRAFLRNIVAIPITVTADWEEELLWEEEELLEDVSEELSDELVEELLEEDY